MSVSSIFKRKGSSKLYAKLQDVDGKWHQVSTGYDETERAAAEAWVAEQERDVEKVRKHKRNGETGALTLDSYASSWLKKRKTATVNDDKTRLELHILPRIGMLPIADIRPRHCRDVIMAHREAGELAPKTIRELASLMTTVFKSALIDEVVTMQPSIYEKNVLPKKADKDPTWRVQAIFAREEVVSLLSDVRIPPDRQQLYALKFFAGRHKEVSALTWREYDSAMKPLGALNLGETKSGVPRRIPVHPVHAKMLAEWKLSGWKETYGRRPMPGDLIVPTRAFRKRAASESQKQFVADLKRLGLRVEAGKARKRRGHDLRRTFISLARTDGAIKDTLRLVTHGPSAGDMMDVYTHLEWSALCAEVAKLRLELPTGDLVQLGAVA